MILQYKGKEKADVKSGRTDVMLKVIERTEDYYYSRLLREKEDIRLIQGYMQALSAIKEALSP